MEHFSDRLSALDFSGRGVIVTGGTRGLGRTICRTFLDAGADVVTCARSAPEEDVASSDGARLAAFIETDVRDADQVEALVAAAAERMGRGVPPIGFSKKVGSDGGKGVPLPKVSKNREKIF